MHILLIHQAFAGLDEAGGTRHMELARLLVRRGHQVTIIASPISYLSGKTRTGKMFWDQIELSDPGITIHRTYTYPALHRSFFHRILSFLSFMVSSFLAAMKVKKVDLVWGTSPPIFQGITAWLVARLKGVPFLFEVRDLWPAFAIAVGVLRNPLLIALSNWLEKFLYSHADRVMVNSPGYLDHVSLRGAKWVELVPNGADPTMFDPLSTGKKFRDQWSLEDNFIALYAGAHGLSNDLTIVLNAAERLREFPQIKIVLVGDGKEKSHLIEQSKKMGLDNVLFVPAAPKNEIGEVIAAADACIAILKPLEMYKTTYPNKVFDYMAAGRPVVLAIDGVIREVVEQAGAGLYCEPGDPIAMANTILRLSQNPGESKKMGAAGRNYVQKNFDRNRLADQLAMLLEDLWRKNG